MFGNTSARKYGKASRILSVMAAVLLCAVAGHAQLTFGDYLKMNLNGDLGFGYNGSSGNGDIGSSHSQGMNGDANLTGYYFHPNFFSFQVRPYYDRNQSNSESQSITRSTGIGASVGFFGGSRFPGSISYGKDFSTNSEFRVAGVPTISDDSNGRTFGITWSALVPRLPTLTVSYASGATESSLADTTSSSSSKNLNLSSGYRLLGFDLRADYARFSTSFTTPLFLTSDTLNNHGTGDSYGVSVRHDLPLRGAFSAGWNHSDNTNDAGSDWSTNSYNASTSINPLRMLSLYQTATYTSNLTAAFAQAIGATGNAILNDRDSNGVFYTSGASLALGHGLSLNGHYSHRVQWFAGSRNEDSQYGGSVNFNHASRLFGFLYFGVGVMDTASRVGNEGVGLNATLGASRRFGHWETGADFNYTQDIQTLNTIAATSNLSYGVTARRKVSRELSFGGAFRQARSALVVQEGNGNHAESASGSITWRKYNIAASYSQSSGTAVLNSSGTLTPTPGGPLITEDFLLFDARSFSVFANTYFFRRLSVGGGYSRFNSSTTQTAQGLLTSGERYNVRTDYRVRKFSLGGGFARSMQDVSTLPGGPRLVNSYFVSLSRWFNVF